MPKAISNVNYTDENKLFPSVICNLISQGKVSPDQIYGCSSSNNSCITNPSLDNCHYDACMISQCRKVSTLDACQKRTDANADRVCEWKNDYFCVSTSSTSKFRGEYYEALKWAVSRNKLEESINATNPTGNVIACCNETGCQLDSGIGCGIGSNLTAGDLFAKTYIHNFKNNASESFDRHPLGEMCEGFVVTTTETSTVTVTNNDLVKALGSSGFGLSTLFAIWVIVLFFRIKHHTGNWW